MSSHKPVRVGSITDIWSFLMSINWEEETWLWYLMAFHLLCSVLTMVAMGYKKFNPQAVLFFVYLAFIYCAEYLNEWAASNYKSFSHQQYFDSSGMFISLLYSLPLLLNCIVFVVVWLYDLVNMLVKVKRHQLKEQTEQHKQAQEDKDK